MDMHKNHMQAKKLASWEVGWITRKTLNNVSRKLKVVVCFVTKYELNKDKGSDKYNSL